MDLGKDEKPVLQQTQSQPKLTYRSPRLTGVRQAAKTLLQQDRQQVERGPTRTDRRA